MRANKMLIFITTLILFTFISGFSQTNLLTNGDFENGTNNWTSWGASLSTSLNAHSGSSSVLVGNRTSPWDGLARNVTSILENGKTYNLSAWVKILNPVGNFRVELIINTDCCFKQLFFFTSPNPAIGSYTQYKNDSLYVSWIGNLVSASLIFASDGVNNAYSSYLVDDVTLVGVASDINSVPVGTGLKDIKSSMLIGGYADMEMKNYFTNAKARAQVISECNAVTIGCNPNGRLWDETLHNVYHVDNFNYKAKEVKKNKLSITAMPLLGWDYYFPAWWYQNNNLSADSIEIIMKSWLRSIIKYNGNDTLVDSWDVVNEAISWGNNGGYWTDSNVWGNQYSCHLQKLGWEPDSSGLKGSMFVNASHPVYIRKAFEYARTLTNKKLELRDGDFEFPNSEKYNAFYQLVTHLKKVHTPINVIGFQMHINLDHNYDWDGLARNIKRYRQLGYEVNISETEIGDTVKSWSDEKAALQKMRYYRLVSASTKGGANNFQLFGFNDDNVYGFFRSGENPLPFNYYFEPKPAYYGIKEAMIDMSQILYWEMDTTDGSIMHDVMNYNNDGALNNFGTPVIVNGFKSKALQFNGVDNYISTGILSDSITGNLTFSCYIKTSTRKPGIIADIAKAGSSGLKVGINADGKLYLNAAEAGLSSDLVSTTPINDGAWHFVALQRDSNNYRLYLDAATSIANGVGSVQTFVKLSVGAASNGSAAFAGAIDEVKLYNTAVEEASFTRSMLPYCPLSLSGKLKDKQIKLSWISQSINEDGFIIEKQMSDNGWNMIATVDTNTLMLTDTIEFANTTYSYRVKAFNKFGNSDPSNIVSVIVPKDTLTNIIINPSFSLSFNSFIYPNPVKNTFTLISPINSSTKIFDISGRIMLEKRNLSGKEIIDIKQFSNGIYILKTNTSKKMTVIKILKQ
jgi:endo-1,4-beta-xylanase